MTVSISFIICYAAYGTENHYSVLHLSLLYSAGIRPKVIVNDENNLFSAYLTLYQLHRLHNAISHER